MDVKKYKNDLKKRISEIFFDMFVEVGKRRKAKEKGKKGGKRRIVRGFGTEAKRIECFFVLNVYFVYLLVNIIIPDG